MFFVSILVSSLAGSIHCAAMCGGFACYYASQSRKAPMPHLAYNIGRLCTYLSLGLIAGMVGQSLSSIGDLIGFQRLASYLLGTLLILWGIYGLLDRKIQLLEKLTQRYKLLITETFGQVVNQHSWTLRAFLVGLFSTMLPCGWLYGYVTLAAATGSPLLGALSMLAFWIGTVPMMLTIGVLSRSVGSRLYRFFPIITSVLFIAAGIYSILGHLSTSMHHMHHAMP